MAKKFQISNFKFQIGAKMVFVALLFVFLAVGCGKGKELENSSQQTANQPISKSENQQVSKPANQTEPEDHPIMILVSQTVEGLVSGGEEASFSIPDETKALLLLKMGVKNVETKTFSGVGEYVTSINGIKEDSGKNFWAFYVNGKQANLGASDYKLKSGDKVVWKLEEIK